MNQPRILLSAPSSGTGKTLITCAILQALKNRGLRTASFKCGPDYIDPMFHSQVLGIPSRNLDSFFSGEETLRFQFASHAGTDFSVIEGAMGYYDGLAGISEKASAYDVARITKTPAVLIVNARGMSRSVIALIKGFLELEEESWIRGVILNQITSGMAAVLKPLIEEALPVKVLGFFPKQTKLTLDSRHLGLKLPGEIKQLGEKLNALAALAEESIDIEQLLQLGQSASKLEYSVPVLPRVEEKPVVAVAKDEAFCFLYQENLEILEAMGAKLCYFSPMHDSMIPEADGMLLCGGYPELYGSTLEANQTMRESIRMAVTQGMPCLAECGGFLYLQESLKDQEGKLWQMAGALNGSSYATPKLNRFGYITLTSKEGNAFGKPCGSIRGHEFHYFESTDCGEAFQAQKPLRKRGWTCMHSNPRLLAGFPHLSYSSAVEMPKAFLEQCAVYKKEKQGQVTKS